MRHAVQSIKLLVSNGTPCLDCVGLSARERNQLKRELKRKVSLKPSLSSKRSKTAVPAAVQPLLSYLAGALTVKHHEQGLGRQALSRMLGTQCTCLTNVRAPG